MYVRTYIYIYASNFKQILMNIYASRIDFYMSTEYLSTMSNFSIFKTERKKLYKMKVIYYKLL